MQKSVKPALGNSQRGCLVGFAVVWTAFSLFFLVMALRDAGSGPGFFGALFILPFLAIGIGLLCFGLAPAFRALKVSPPEVLVTSDMLRLGEPFTFTLRQEFKAPLHVESARADLVLRESASYTRGTDRYTDTHEQILGSAYAPAREYRAGERLELSETFTIPANGMHTFQGKNNKIEYFIKVSIIIAKWPDVKEDYPVVVVPERYHALREV